MGNCVTAQVRHVSGASQGSRTLAGSGRGQKGNVGDNGEREDLVPAVALTQQFVPHAFTYADLKQATRNFRPDTLLGEGGFGSVFKGNIDERTFQPARVGQGMLVAVKKLNKDSLQGDKEWLAELKYLGALRHPNVVKLFGYCCEGDYRLLVYEFFPRGSLENHLFGRSGHTLPWNTRLKIAVDAAKGLTFLHNAKIPVIYRDFKSSNILLDSEFNAKLSDFGLAKDGPTGDKTHVTTQVLGTYGYAAPEYVATGKLTPKSDVYGFGVVLLEILTGKRAVDKARNGGEINLVEWATPYLIDKRKWSRVLDQRLDGQYSFKGAHIAANVSLQCLCSDPKLRPTMQDVLESLQPLVDPKASASARSSSKSKGKSPYNTPNRDRKDINVSKQGHEVDADAKPTIAFKLPSPTHDASKLQKQDPSVCPSPTASPLRMK